MIDVNQELAEGQALDLIHGSSLVADQTIGTDPAAIASSDVIIITAGLRRKPDESRLDLINRNVDLFRKILAQVKQQGTKQDAIVFVVSNPVDVLTYLAVRELSLPAEKVIGLGTMLDTTRLQGMLARQLQVPPTQVSAMMLGEHGDSMVAIWSAAQIAGLPLERYPGVNPSVIADVEKRTRGSGAEVIKKKGGAGFAVGVAIAHVVHSIALDQRRILPVSSLQTGAYGIRDVCLSVPTVVGRSGVSSSMKSNSGPKSGWGLSTRPTCSGKRSAKCWPEILSGYGKVAGSKTA